MALVLKKYIYYRAASVALQRAIVKGLSQHPSNKMMWVKVGLLN